MKRIAILGAGPIGLEAALYARRLGHPVTVYEKEKVGASVARWGHVRMFSPWRMNVSPLALSALADEGWTAPDPESFPTGREFLERYLIPLAEVLAKCIWTGTEVLGIAREGLLKGEAIGGDKRAGRPFRLLLGKGPEESWAEADVVIDASGTFGSPNHLGHGGLPAPGERAVAQEIEHGPPDILGEDRPKYAQRTVLLLGAGHSAATSLLSLVHLLGEEPETRIIWAHRSEREEPFPEIPADPLPGRLALAREGNRLARERPGGLTTIRGVMVESIEREGSGLRVRFAAPHGARRRADCLVERIIANVGYRPDLALERELQAHFCYASEGSMRLSAKLLGAGTDCLQMPPVGPDAYRHPEPEFFVLGQKSYGRNPAFLLQNGRAGVQDVFRIIQEKVDLDLYRA